MPTWNSSGLVGGRHCNTFSQSLTLTLDDSFPLVKDSSGKDIVGNFITACLLDAPTHMMIVKDIRINSFRLIFLKERGVTVNRYVIRDINEINIHVSIWLEEETTLYVKFNDNGEDKRYIQGFMTIDVEYIAIKQTLRDIYNGDKKFSSIPSGYTMRTYAFVSRGHARGSNKTFPIAISTPGMRITQAKIAWTHNIRLRSMITPAPNDTYNIQYGNETTIHGVLHSCPGVEQVTFIMQYIPECFYAETIYISALAEPSTSGPSRTSTNVRVRANRAIYSAIPCRNNEAVRKILHDNIEPGSTHSPLFISTIRRWGYPNNDNKFDDASCLPIATATFLNFAPNVSSDLFPPGPQSFGKAMLNLGVRMRIFCVQTSGHAFNAVYLKANLTRADMFNLDNYLFFDVSQLARQSGNQITFFENLGTNPGRLAWNFLTLCVPTNITITSIDGIPNSQPMQQNVIEIIFTKHGASWDANYVNESQWISLWGW